MSAQAIEFHETVDHHPGVFGAVGSAQNHCRIHPAGTRVEVCRGSAQTYDSGDFTDILAPGPRFRNLPFVLGSVAGIIRSSTALIVLSDPMYPKGHGYVTF